MVAAVAAAVVVLHPEEVEVAILRAVEATDHHPMAAVVAVVVMVEDTSREEDIEVHSGDGDHEGMRHIDICNNSGRFRISRHFIALRRHIV